MIVRVAPLVGAELARIVFGQRKADRAEAHVVLDRQDRFGEALRFVARTVEQIKDQTRGGLWTDRRELAELVDQRRDRARRPSVAGLHNPGIRMPPVTEAIRFCDASAALFSASLTATTTRSSSVSMSSGSTASLPIFTRLTR